MKRILLLAAAATALYASDYTGIYARIDRVVLEPAAGEPQAVQVWGVFAFADPADRNAYLPPSRGYIYLKPDRNAEAARSEWSDLKKLAGSAEVVGFSSRSAPLPRLRKSDEAPGKPDSYVPGASLNKFRGDTNYPPVRSILDFKN